eukprot:720673_1
MDMNVMTRMNIKMKRKVKEKVIYTKQKMKQKKSKNKIIRHYVIDKIQKGTSRLALCIVAVGLVKGIFYSSLNHFVWFMNCIVSFHYSLKELVYNLSLATISTTTATTA